MPCRWTIPEKALHARQELHLAEWIWSPCPSLKDEHTDRVGRSRTRFAGVKTRAPLEHSPTCGTRHGYRFRQCPRRLYQKPLKKVLLVAGPAPARPFVAFERHCSRVGFEPTSLTWSLIGRPSASTLFAGQTRAHVISPCCTRNMGGRGGIRTPRAYTGHIRFQSGSDTVSVTLPNWWL